MSQKDTVVSSIEPLRKKKMLPNLFFGVLIIGIIASTGAAGYFYWQNRELKKNPQLVAQEEVAQIVAKVSKLIILPDGETPTLATVSDPEKLKDQPFFLNAKQGYKVLIYANAKKAILYDPIQNKIAEVAPLNIENQSPNIVEE